MADLNIDRLDELEKHVEALVAKPETQIDAKLFDDVELQLTREFDILISIFHDAPSVTTQIVLGVTNPTSEEHFELCKQA